MKGRTLLAILATLLTSMAGAQANLQVMIANGQAGISNIGANVSINDQGIIGFSGNDSGGSKAFVVTAPGVVHAVTTITGSNRTYSGVGISNGANPWLAARELVTGPSTIVRRWGVNDSSNTIVGSSVRGDFDSCSSFCDVNDSGVVCDTSLIGGSTSTAVIAGVASPPMTLATYTGIPLIRPQIANNGDVVYRDNIGRIVVINYPSGQFKLAIGSGSGFTSATLRRPGISPDGSTIGFVGNRGSGIGLFLSLLKSDGTRLLAPIAGEGLGDGFSDFQEDQRVGVIHKTLEPGHTQQITAVFVGTLHNVVGIYLLRVIANDSGIQSISDPIKVVAIGDTIPGGGGAVTGVKLYDPINKYGQVGFYADLASGGPLLVKASFIDVTFNDTGGAEEEPILPPSILRLNLDINAWTQSRQPALLKISTSPLTPIRVYVEGLDYSGGHQHDSLIRPHGWLRKGTQAEPWQSYPPYYGSAGYMEGGTTAYSDYANGVSLITDTSGNAQIYYIASEFGGTETVTVAMENANPAARVSGIMNIQIGALNLSPLPANPDIEFRGSTPEHPDNHYGKPEMIAAINTLARNYFDQRNLKLPVNDISLVQGGLFDISGQWHTSHIGHRLGFEFDTGGSATTLKVPNALFEQIVDDTGLFTWVFEGTPAHYHLVLTDPGKVTYRPVIAATRWVNKASHIMDVDVKVKNYGGITSTDGQLTAMSLSNGATIQSYSPSLPIDLSNLAPSGYRLVTIRIVIPSSYCIVALGGVPGSSYPANPTAGIFAPPEKID